MPGQSRSKNGVASLAYVPGIHVFKCYDKQDVDGRVKPGHDGIAYVTVSKSLAQPAGPLSDWPRLH